MDVKQKHTMFIGASLGVGVLTLTACGEAVDRDQLVYEDSLAVVNVMASVETTPVDSTDDAADDPAIWVHPIDASKSLILGTDKQAGIGVYNLAGEQVQFFAFGRPNNVDVRQDVMLQNSSRDIGAFSDRATNTVGWFTIDESGIEYLASFPAQDEPYGFCLGTHAGTVSAFVTYKNGLLEQYALQDAAVLDMPLVASYQLDSQLEGCVYDEPSDTLFVGEEEHGIWAFADVPTGLTTPTLIDVVDSKNGITADIEGVSVYRGEQAYLVVSSQGNDSYALYDLAAPYAFRARFRITAGDVIDGAQETDGIESTAATLPGYPKGLLVVQDGFNNDGLQNFKYVHADFAKLIAEFASK
jgi:3-phytase